MTNIKRLVEKIWTKNLHSYEIRIFRIVIYSVLLLYIIFLFGAYDLLLVPGSFGNSNNIQTTFFNNVFHFLDLTSPPWHLVFYSFYILVLLIGILRKSNYFIPFFIYLGTFIIFNKITMVTTGGHYLVNVVLFFNMFFLEKDRENGTQRLLSNIMFFAAQMQVIYMYVASAFYKLSGNLWPQGIALKYIVLDPTYSTPFWSGFLLEHSSLLYIGNYFVLVYSLLFPIVIWIKPFKKVWLLIGIVFHLFILVIIGLPDFPLFVIACYALFMKWNQQQGPLPFYTKSVIKLRSLKE